jgi:hypothetical protein
MVMGVWHYISFVPVVFQDADLRDFMDSMAHTRLTKDYSWMYGIVINIIFVPMKLVTTIDTDI